MWFKVDGNLAFHPKVIAAGNEAMGLWVRAGAWSCEQMTDGFVPTGIANAMANGMASAIALVMANLWQEVDGGYQFKDWDEFQPSGEEERARKRELSEKRKAAGKKGAAKRWNSNSHSKPMANAMASAMANGWQTDSPDPDPDISTPKGVEGMRKPQRQAYPDEFERFWSEYPVKRDKGKALKAWKNATKRANNDELIAGAVRYRNDPNREDQYTKYAEGWLNGDGWEDEPLPDRNRPSERVEPRTFDQIRHDQNLELWSRVKAEEEGGDDTWPRRLEA